MARVEVVERAVQRVEQFFAHIQEGRFERALDHVIENNIHEDQSISIKRLLGTAFRTQRFDRSNFSFDRIGMQEVGPYVIRVNYLLRTGATSVPITFVLSRVCDDWALEHFALTQPKVDGKGGSSSPVHWPSV